MNDDKIDLNEIANRPSHNLTIVPREDPAERDARLRREDSDATHRQRKDWALHVVTLIVLVATFGLCVWTVLKPSATAEDIKWAVPLLTAIATGLVGYVTGKTAK